MRDIVPSGKKFDRKTLERIIQRAAELQTNQQDIGDELTEDQVLELGKEVGLPARYVQQAILEETTQARQAGERSALTRWMGAKRLYAQRTVPGDEEHVEKALKFWMENEELLTVKRRFKEATTWEPKKGFLTALRRMGGKTYALYRAREVMGSVTQLEAGWSHVRLEADLTNTYRDSVLGAAACAVGGAAIVAGLGVAGIALPFLLAPAAVATVATVGVGSTRRQSAERVKVSLEQILDRLEHREIKPEDTRGAGGNEISRALGEVKRQLRNLGPGKF